MERVHRQENLFNKYLQFIIPFGFVLIAYFFVTLHSGRVNEETSFFKRIDEIEGIQLGRQVAAFGNWQPINSPTKIKMNLPSVKAPVAVSSTNEAKEDVFIEGNVSYELIEVFNPQKFAVNIKASQFNGGIEIDRNTIRSLTVSLPDGSAINLPYSEIIGKRVFKYNHEGEELSGLIYQAEDDIFVVSFVNGPYNGTRLKFGKEKIIEQEVAAPMQANLENQGQQNGVDGSAQQQPQNQQIDGFQI